MMYIGIGSRMGLQYNVQWYRVKDGVAVLLQVGVRCGLAVRRRLGGNLKPRVIQG